MLETINPLSDTFRKIMPEHVARHDVMRAEHKGIRDYLAAKGITSVWHFTDYSNLKSIERYGLLSLAQIDEMNMDVVYSAADGFSRHLDRAMGLDAFVHLSFIQDHPLYHVALRDGRIIDPVWIEIDISVVFETDTRFCRTVANARTADLFAIDKLIKNIDFDTMLMSSLSTAELN